MPGIFLSSIAVWLITFSTTKYVSLGSLVFGIALPLFAVLFGKPFYTVFFSATICLIITYTHRENIVRLIQRRESKTHLFVKKG
jgi:glycerol-3-phosphate acyltransferase PlsY